MMSRNWISQSNAWTRRRSSTSEPECDEGVAALDVLIERREEGDVLFGKEFALTRESLARLAFEHLQIEGELGDFHGLRVEVHAVDIVAQDAALEIDR